MDKFKVGDLLRDKLEGCEQIPIGLKIDCYINPDGVDSNTDNGWSEYIEVQKEITLYQLEILLEGKHPMYSFGDGTMELSVDDEQEEDMYKKVTDLII